MKILIGLCGVKFSGKTTAFNIIKDLYPQVQEIQLAKKLKDECSRIFKVKRELFDDSQLKEVPLEMPIYLTAEAVTEMVEAFGIKVDYDTHVRKHVGMILESPRRIAQYAGTEILRACGEDIHCIGATMNLPHEGVFVITDMRFPNEFDFFTSQYADIFVPFHIQSNRAEAGGAQDMHPSERMVLETAKRCKKIDNNGSLADLKARLEKELEPLAVALKS